MPARLTPDQLARDLAVPDLTDPAQGRHAVQLVVESVVDALARRWGCAVRWWRGDRIVAIEDNYDNLGYAAEDVTRDARYSRYVDHDRMLRSHSTAMVPAALREVARDPAPDVLLVCPGVVYRRDSIDRLHAAAPHQLDLWRLTHRRPPLAEADLAEMVAALVHAALPGARHRSEARVHPYTVDGCQIDVAGEDGWVEIAECGLAHPAVLRAAGVDDRWSGLALGMGLDRTVMLRKRIPDIRLLRSTEPAVTAQLANLAPYRPVSTMPPDRTLSNQDANLLRDRIYAALHQGTMTHWAAGQPGLAGHDRRG